MKLNDKKVLLFAPNFFDYYAEIKREFESRGTEVDVILDSYASVSALYRFILIKNKSLRQQYAKSKIKKSINEVTYMPDYVLVIRGEALSKTLMKIMKEKFSKAVFIMYQWDSVNNNPNAIEISRYFDRKLTFDIDDAEKYNWEYRPLFFIEEDIIQRKDYKYDLAFIGTLYYKRAKLLKELKKFANTNNYILYDYMFSPKNVFFLHKYIMQDSRYKDIDITEVKFQALSMKELKNVYKSSRILVDYAADDQSGLTMRTIESIGFRCKLITNNQRIKESDFYNPNNIYVYDLDNFSIPKNFIETNYIPIDECKYRYYSLSGWIDSIFQG